MLKDESLHEVPGYEGSFEVPNLGRVRNALTRPIRKQYRRWGSGYCQVSVRTPDGKVRSVYVHRAVLEAFNPPSGTSRMESHHRNFDTSDNRLVNLEWVSKVENLRYSWRAGRQASGNRIRSRLMTERNLARRPLLGVRASVLGAGAY